MCSIFQGIQVPCTLLYHKQGQQMLHWVHLCTHGRLEGFCENFSRFVIDPITWEKIFPRQSPHKIIQHIRTSFPPTWPEYDFSMALKDLVAKHLRSNGINEERAKAKICGWEIVMRHIQKMKRQQRSWDRSQEKYARKGRKNLSADME